MGNYRKDGLCKKHAASLKHGEIVQCEKCGKWHDSGKACECAKNGDKYSELPTSGFEKCVLCGETTNGHAFCYKCFKAHNEKELLEILNKKSGGKKAPQAKQKEQEFAGQSEEVSDDENNKTIVIDSNNKSRCIACGYPTDGLLFCSRCYKKYNNKQLLFRISNCTHVELLDAEYEGRLECIDGHVVKSKSEREIDDYLFRHNIPHIYEKKFFYGATKKDVMRPDFCLPDYLGQGEDVYIEHWGYNENNIEYTKSKKFKLEQYEKSRVTLICTYEKTDIGNIEATLDRKLNKNYIKPHQINE